ncbi:MAG: hypothetical protein ACRENG_04910 [bacterium]
MMESKQSTKEARISLLVALAWLAFLACNKNDQLLAPEKSDLKLTSNFQAVEDKFSSNFQTAALKSSSDDDLATICRRDKNEIGTSTALIGPAGGVLTRAKHQLVIPAGALSKTVKVTFSILASAYLECELKPYGLRFNKPVYLILSYNGACDRNLDESALKVAYYNPQTQLGVLIPTAIDSELNTVTVELEKFAFSTSNVSRYGLIRR